MGLITSALAGSAGVVVVIGVGVSVLVAVGLVWELSLTRSLKLFASIGTEGACGLADGVCCVLICGHRKLIARCMARDTTRAVSPNRYLLVMLDVSLRD